MNNDDPKKAEKQKKKDEYYLKVLGQPDKSLIDDDPVKQKEILVKESERIARLAAEDGSSIAVSTDCNKLLDEARVLLKEEKPDTNAVLSKFDKVKQRLIRAYNSRAVSNEWFSFVALYNFILLGCLVGLIFFNGLVPGQSRLESSAFVCLACALWGGVGSIVDAFGAIHTHFSNQDFDKNYWPWYWAHPLLGLSLGAVVYLVLQAGLLTISGTPLQEAATANVTAVSTLVTTSNKVGVTALPIVLAFLAGFRQRTVVDFLTRIVKAVFQKE